MSYPYLSDVVKALTGIDIPLPIATFGLMVAAAMVAVGWTMGLEFLKTDRTIAVGIDFLEDFSRFFGVFLGPWTGFEFFEAHRAVGIRIQFLEDFFRIRAFVGTVRAAGAFGRTGRFFAE